MKNLYLVITAILLWTLSPLFGQDFETGIKKLIDANDCIGLDKELTARPAVPVYIGEYKCPAIIYALLNRRPACAEVLINHGAPVNETFTDGNIKNCTALHIALYNEYTQVVLNLLYHGANASVQFEQLDWYKNMSALDLAEEKQVLPLFEGTREMDAKTQKQADLVAAVQAGDVKKVTALLATGMETDFFVDPFMGKDFRHYKWNLMELAIEQGNLGICKILEKHFLDSDGTVGTRYMEYSLRFKHPDLFRYFYPKRHPNLKADNYLIYALYTNDPKIITLLLSQIRDITHIYGINGTSVIQHALRSKNPEIAHMIIQHYLKDNTSKKAFSFVYENNSKSLIKLIDAGGDVNMTCGWLSLLGWASFLGRDEIVSILLKSKAQVNIKDKDEFYAPLWQAATMGNKTAIELLVKNGANCSLYSSYLDYIPVRESAQEEFFSLVDIAYETLGLKSAQFLIENGAETETLELSGWGVYTLSLITAIKKDDIDFVRFLLDTAFPESVTCAVPLETAVEYKRRDIIEYYIKKGYDFSNYDTLLEKAVKNGDTEMFEYLYKKYNKVQWNAIVYSAVTNDAKNILEFLIAQNIPILIGHPDSSFHEYKGKTPLFYAISEDVARLIVDAGADVNKIAGDNTTPLYFTVLKKKYDLISFLINHGADINKITGLDNRISGYEIEWSHHVELEKHSTALDAAETYRIYKLLKDHGARHFWEVYYKL